MDKVFVLEVASAPGEPASVEKTAVEGHVRLMSGIELVWCESYG